MPVKLRCQCGVELIAFTKKPGEKLRCHACGTELVVPSSSTKDSLRTGVIHTMKPREIHKLRMKAQGLPFEESGELSAPLEDERSGGKSQDASCGADADKLQALPPLDEILEDGDQE
ncbi:MAG: hypothetical protein JW808_05855 [Victivallales bacterium]|nr:hypothetical protein [Victivallales bacterium]